ncbi:hypothetical protein BLNAU_623 [Blattamonas nauphoetae]|uniref:Uncharacterized protein n=1 Tax=Blattamonas nauphoetae TaxID=2049346 RepID=A0ABQ9YK27_9EUKA|nr:hypothetical protein BLNAU_623 [Blattamonas nauphoetae]
MHLLDLTSTGIRTPLTLDDNQDMINHAGNCLSFPKTLPLQARRSVHDRYTTQKLLMERLNRVIVRFHIDPFYGKTIQQILLNLSGTSAKIQIELHAKI